MGVASLLVVAVLAAGPDDKPMKIDPAQLVGVWEQVKDAGGVPAGSTTEFAANGQYHFRPKARNISEYHSTYKVEGDQIAIESMNPGLVPGLDVSVIELTPTKLVLGMDGEREFRRVGGPTRAAGSRSAQRSTSATFNLGGSGQTAKPGQWAVVRSAEDGYQVEMPGPFTSESEEEGMGFSVRTRSRQTPDAEYVVIVAKAPTAIPTDDREQVLQRMAIKFAERFGSNVQVNGVGPGDLGRIVGRVYDLSIDRPGSGVGAARCRIIPQEKSAFALLVLPVRAEPIPAADARKFLNSFALGKEAPAGRDNAELNPARSRSGMMPGRRGAGAGAGARAGGMMPSREAAVVWGNEVDPSGDVQFGKIGSALSLAIPSTPHLLAPERDLMNAPRVVMPVGGDFAVAVRVEGKFDPSDKSTTKGLSSRQSGGLIVWKDAQNYLVVQRRASSGGEDGKDQNQVVLEELVNGAKGVTQRQAIPKGAIHLRIDREGTRIKAEVSPDGRRWADIKPVNASWAEGQLEVGVVATSNSTTPHAVTFDNYQLMPR